MDLVNSIQIRSRYMRSLYSAIFCLCFCVISASAAELDSDLAEELLLEEKYEKSLTLAGTSGLMLTASTEGLYQGAFFAGFNGFIDRTTLPGDTEADHDFGMNLNVCIGVWDDIFNLGVLRNLELSVNLPAYAEDISEDGRNGTGDAKVTAKVEWLEEDPLKPEIPAISFLLTGIFPTGYEEFRTIEKGSVGVEAGIIFGTKIPDSSERVLFDLYIEFRYSYLEYINLGADSFITSNVGISFPISDVPNTLLIIEWENVSSNDTGFNGPAYLLGIRYKNSERDITVGFKFRDYEEQDVIERQIYVSWVGKW